MAFDALHVIWTTHHTQQPDDAKGNWLALHDLYKQLTQDGHYYEMSASVIGDKTRTTSQSNAVILTLSEQDKVESTIAALTAPDGDRIAGSLPLTCFSVGSNMVQMLFAPALPSHSQIVGRLKSKTASRVLWSPERNGQKHIWSSGYWFANINGAEAVAKVARFIQQRDARSNS